MEKSSESLIRDFLQAASTGDIDQLARLTFENPELINSREEGRWSMEWTGLHLAARCRQVAVAGFLLSHNANVHLGDSWNQIALHLAAQEGNIEILTMLLANGANVNARAKNGGTPLHLAVESGSAQIVELLIGNGAEVDARSNGGDTPLIFATMHSRGESDVVRVLLSHGADCSAVGDTGRSALHFAAEDGYEEIARMLLMAHADPHLQDIFGCTPRSLAEATNQTAVVDLLKSCDRRNTGKPDSVDGFIC